MLFNITKETKEIHSDPSVSFSIDKALSAVVVVFYLLYKVIAEPTVRRINLHLDFIATFSLFKKAVNFSTVTAPHLDFKHISIIFRRIFFLLKN